MICPNCGTFIDPGEPWCPYCLWKPSEYDGGMDPIYDDLEGEERTYMKCGRPFKYDPKLMREEDYCPQCLDQTLETCIECGKKFWCSIIESPICPECKEKYPISWQNSILNW